MTIDWLRRHRRLMSWTAGAVALLVVGMTGTGYEMLRHFNHNIDQVNITNLMAKDRPAKGPTGAQNILLIGSGTPLDVGNQNQPGQTTVMTHTLMLLHLPSDNKSAQVVSIPINSWVTIPACQMGNGQMSASTKGPVNEAFAIGNRFGNKTALGLACLVNTIELNTSVRIDHFIQGNFDGLQAAVNALNGVTVCNPTPINNPSTGFSLAAGCQSLNGAQAVDYATGIYGIDPIDQSLLISRQQELASALFSRAQSQLYNPVTIYKFLNAVTSSLTIDSQLGGITGLYDLINRVRLIPLGNIDFYTLPTTPGTGNSVVWKQPAASKIFTDLRNDVAIPASLAQGEPMCSASQGSHC